MFLVVVEFYSFVWLVVMMSVLHYFIFSSSSFYFRLLVYSTIRLSPRLFINKINSHLLLINKFEKISRGHGISRPTLHARTEINATKRCTRNRNILSIQLLYF